MTVLTFPARTSQPLRQQVTENIRALMARRGIHQMQIMAVLGLSQPAVSRRLNGHHTWDVDELEMIAAAFEVPVNELLGAAGSEVPRPTSPETAANGHTVGYSHRRLTLVDDLAAAA